MEVVPLLVAIGGAAGAVASAVKSAVVEGALSVRVASLEAKAALARTDLDNMARALRQRLPTPSQPDLGLLGRVEDVESRADAIERQLRDIGELRRVIGQLEGGLGALQRLVERWQSRP